MSNTEGAMVDALVTQLEPVLRSAEIEIYCEPSGNCCGLVFGGSCENYFSVASSKL